MMSSKHWNSSSIDFLLSSSSTMLLQKTTVIISQRLHSHIASKAMIQIFRWQYERYNVTNRGLKVGRMSPSEPRRASATNWNKSGSPHCQVYFIFEPTPGMMRRTRLFPTPISILKKTLLGLVHGWEWWIWSLITHLSWQSPWAGDKLPQHCLCFESSQQGKPVAEIPQSFPQ